MDFLHGSYIEIVFAVLLNYQTGLSWDNWSMWLNNLALFWHSGMLVLYPAFLLYTLYYKIDKPD